jgi:hypothetical protein
LITPFAAGSTLTVIMLNFMAKFTRGDSVRPSSCR